MAQVESRDCAAQDRTPVVEGTKFGTGGGGGHSSPRHNISRRSAIELAAHFGNRAERASAAHGFGGVPEAAVGVRMGRTSRSTNWSIKRGL